MIKPPLRIQYRKDECHKMGKEPILLYLGNSALIEGDHSISEGDYFGRIFMQDSWLYLLAKYKQTNV